MPSESKLYIVGIGPGRRDQLTWRAAEVLGQVENVVGYGAYLDLVSDFLGDKDVASTGMGREVDRAKMAVDLLEEGSVAFISSGDPNVYGMAGLGLEVASERVGLDRVEVVPGVTSFNAAACKTGLTFRDSVAVTSLSDLLTPWNEIESRITTVAKMNMPIAIYNPKSKKRTWQLSRILDILVQCGRGDELLLIAKNVSRDGEDLSWTTVSKMLKSEELRETVDMFTLILIGGKGMSKGGYSPKSQINVVGVGPGDPAHLTLEARKSLSESDLGLGAERYLEVAKSVTGGKAISHKGALEYRMEARLAMAKEAANLGKTVSILSGGDPGIFSSSWRIFAQGDYHAVSGLSAFSAVASRLGAPLVNDFVLLSGLKENAPDDVFSLMERGFGVVIYNVDSKNLLPLIERIKNLDRPCALARDVTRTKEWIEVTRTTELSCQMADGNRYSLVIAGPNSYIKEGRIIARRGYQRRYSY